MKLNEFYREFNSDKYQIKNVIDDNEFYNIYGKAITLSKELGYDIKYEDIDIELSEEESEVGCLEIVGQNKYVLRITKYLLTQGLQDYLFNTFCHELCHYLQCEYAFSRHIIEFDYQATDKDNKVKNICSNAMLLLNVMGFRPMDSGHSPYWKYLTNQFNQSGQLLFPITPTVSETAQLYIDNVLKNNKNYNYDIVCNKCNESTKFVYYNDLIDTVMNIPESCQCDVCGSKSFRVDILRKDDI